MDPSPKDTFRKLRSSAGRTTRLFLIAAVILLAIEVPLLLGDHPERHIYFPYLDWGWAFYAALGFFGALVLVLVSGGLGSLLRQTTEEESSEESLPKDLDERLR